MSLQDDHPELDDHVEQVEATLEIHAFCEECAHVTGQKRSPPWGERVAGYVLFEMRPGPDGVPWYLCAKHWFDGLHPNDTGAIGTGRVLEADPGIQVLAPLPVANSGPARAGEPKTMSAQAKPTKAKKASKAKG